MAKIYQRQCDNCGILYRSTAKRFCSWSCCWEWRRKNQKPSNSLKGYKRIIAPLHADFNVGKNNGQWKGENVGIKALHIWIRKRMKKPELCECYKKEPPHDLACKGIYNRDFKNWEYLCRRCHMLKDGRMKNLRRGHAIISKFSK